MIFKKSRLASQFSFIQILLSAFWDKKTLEIIKEIVIII